MHSRDKEFGDGVSLSRTSDSLYLSVLKPLDPKLSALPAAIKPFLGYATRRFSARTLCTTGRIESSD